MIGFRLLASRSFKEALQQKLSTAAHPYRINPTRQRAQQFDLSSMIFLLKGCQWALPATYYREKKNSEQAAIYLI